MSRNRRGVEPDDIINLIQPHLANPLTKITLVYVMRQMGIASLPVARPDQYEEMYRRFKAVIDKDTRAHRDNKTPKDII